MKKYLSYFFRTTGPYQPALLLSVLSGIVLALCSFCYVYISKALVDVATGHAQGSFTCWALVFGVIILLRIATRSLRTWLQSRSLYRMKNAMRQRLFDSLLQMSGASRGRMHSGDMVNRIEGDVDAVAAAFCLTLPNLFGTVLQFVVAFIYLVWLDARLAWMLLAIIPPGLLAARYVMHRMRVMSKDVRTVDSHVQAHIQESIQHQTLIKTLEFDGQSSLGLSHLQRELYDNSMKRTRFSVAAHVISALCLSGSYALAFLWGVNGLAAGVVTYGMMTAFLQLVGQVQRPLVEIGEQLPSLFHCTASIDRLEELDALEKEPLCEPVQIPGMPGVRVTDLSFRYQEDSDWIFRHFSYDFKPGSKTAVIGSTGGGKTTLIKLILSLCTPQSGKLTFYSEASGDIPASPATRCNLVYVPQGNSLLSGTIRDNLLMGDPYADEQKMKDALYTAAADFVRELPRGLDSQCAESGGGLSEGQAQRIAIARGLLRPGGVLLLDEFSSALDPDTEKLLLQRLVERRPDSTVIFITHREQIAQYCDRILKL